MSDPNFPPDHRNAPIDLWRRMREFLCECFGLFGEPQELADRHTLLFKDYKLILPWLRAAEALIRRFLLLEAALLPQEAPFHGPPAPSPASSSKQASKRNANDLDPNDPDSWRVSFRSISSSPASRALDARADQNRGGSGSRQSRETKGEVDVCAPSCAAPSDRFATTSPASGGEKDFAATISALSPRFRSAIPLARRFEAILRVYNNPLPFARRLAARIRKASALIKRVLNDGWQSLRGIIENTLHDELSPRVDASARTLINSS